MPRMYVKEDFSGRKIGALTVLTMVETPPKANRKAICLCDCGIQLTVLLSTLRTHPEHKGCSACRELAKNKNRCTHGYAKVSLRGKGTYWTWMNMKSRCFNSNVSIYKYYGGRGITVCERWKNSFQNFLDDMGDKPEGNYSIDRINNDGNYEPGNCRWATKKEQAANRRPPRKRKNFIKLEV